MTGQEKSKIISKKAVCSLEHTAFFLHHFRY